MYLIIYLPIRVHPDPSQWALCFFSFFFFLLLCSRLHVFLFCFWNKDNDGIQHAAYFLWEKWNFKIPHSDSKMSSSRKYLLILSLVIYNFHLFVWLRLYPYLTLLVHTHSFEVFGVCIYIFIRKEVVDWFWIWACSVQFFNEQKWN